MTHPKTEQRGRSPLFPASRSHSRALPGVAAAPGITPPCDGTFNCSRAGLGAFVRGRQRAIALPPSAAGDALRGRARTARRPPTYSSASSDAPSPLGLPTFRAADPLPIFQWFLASLRTPRALPPTVTVSSGALSSGQLGGLGALGQLGLGPGRAADLAPTPRCPTVLWPFGAALYPRWSCDVIVSRDLCCFLRGEVALTALWLHGLIILKERRDGRERGKHPLVLSRR